MWNIHNRFIRSIYAFLVCWMYFFFQQAMLKYFENQLISYFPIQEMKNLLLFWQTNKEKKNWIFANDLLQCTKMIRRTKQQRTVALLCFDLISINIKRNRCFACANRIRYRTASLEWDLSYYILKGSVVGYIRSVYTDMICGCSKKR